MAGVEVVANAWKEWSLQVLVLLSLSLQVILLILAEFRRHINSGVLRALVWSAYMLADTTAIYVLGHLSATSMQSPKHELMVLWGPFLLLHLGGQDNITAYALEDKELWLRHLQTLVVQVAAAAYVVYGFSIIIGDSRSLLLPATILVSLVGVVKYGERVWVLRLDSCRPTEGYDDPNYDGPPPDPQKFLDSPAFTDRSDPEAFLLKAHLLLDFAKGFFGWGPLSDLLLRTTPASRLDGRRQEEEVYKVVEMQLSLIHDLFYTKAELTHTWYGFCIRLVSSLAIGIAFLLFNILILYKHHPNVKGDYNRVDVVITYVLFVGAVVLETMSLLRAMLSSWTFALLVEWCTDTYSGPVEITEGRLRRLGIVVRTFLARVLVSLRRLVRAANWRRRRSWSRSMGQQNLIRLCTRSRDSRGSRMARWMGVEDRWNTWAYSWSVPFSECVKQQLLKSIDQLQKDCTLEICLHVEIQDTGGADLQARQWGRGALKRRGLYKSLAWSVKLKPEESILVWHIATDVFLWSGKDKEDGVLLLVEAARALSNYMVFLLAAQPHMLPPDASRDPYVYMCCDLTGLGRSSAEDVLSLLGRYAASNQSQEFPCDALRLNKTLRQGCRLGAFLIEDSAASSFGGTLEMICQVWADMLCYMGHGCGAHSHAKQLSRGGELLTVAALVAKYATSQEIISSYEEE